MALTPELTRNMPSDVKIDINLKQLENLAQNSKKQFVAKMGLIGASANKRGGGGLTNSEIGVIHEFGSLSKGIPRRSFLKETFIVKQENFNKAIAGFIARDITKKNGMRKIFDSIALYGQGLVAQAFHTSGFGRWKPLSPNTIKAKGSAAILIDTGIMRKSINSKVEEKL